jgi:hypothetical protein
MQHVESPSIVPAIGNAAGAAPVVWLQLLGSVPLALVNPSIRQIDIETVATVLARISRFGGHTEDGAYSVAQHSREGAYAILRDTGRRDWAAAFLLHDAHEFAMGDIATPITDAIEHRIQAAGGAVAAEAFRGAVRSLKADLDAVIYRAAGLSWPLHAETVRVVKDYDVRMCRTERDARLAPPPYRWADVFENAEPVAGVDLWPWSEGVARVYFKAACRDLLPVCGGSIAVDSKQNAG